MTIPIHFAELEDMIPELDVARVVRMTAIAHNITAYDDDPRAVRIRVFLYVRQLGPDNTVLSWAMPIGKPLDTYEGVALDTAEDQQLEELWKYASAVENLIYARLLDQNAMFDIRDGLISIGSSGDDLAGYWRFLDTIDPMNPDHDGEYTHDDTNIDRPRPDPEDELPF